MTRIAVTDGIAYGVRETGTGPVLVMLHGFASSWRTWDTVADALGRGRRLVAVDLLGHGASDSPDPPRHAVERQAADMASIVRRVADEPVDLLGYSFGARVALWLAVTAPTLVARLVLESPSAGVSHPAERAARLAADERWALLLDGGDLAAFHEAWEAQPVFASRAAMPAPARAAIRAEHLAADGPALARSLRGAGQGTMPPLLERLATIRQPSLVLAGDLDPIGRERASVVADLLRDARLEVIEGAGHAAHLERPGRFVELVTTFLAPARVGATTRGEP
jgi:2-succinyl-6-hydroxy-2,4-cyclohexadiene-1-carboxylate synthase